MVSKSLTICKAKVCIILNKDKRKVTPSTSINGELGVIFRLGGNLGLM